MIVNWLIVSDQRKSEGEEDNISILVTFELKFGKA